MELAVYKRLGSYCVAYEDMSGIVIDDIWSQRDAYIILKAIKDGVLSLNSTDAANQINTMRKALEDIENEVFQYSYKDGLRKTIEKITKRGLGK